MFKDPPTLLAKIGDLRTKIVANPEEIFQKSFYPSIP